MRLRSLFELKQNTAVFAFGRLNPPTIGHRALVETIKKQKGEHFLFLSHKQHKKTDPLSYEQKAMFARKSFPNITVGDSSVRTIMDAMKKLESMGFKNIIYVAGSDRVQSFESLLNKYNNIEYNFESINIVSAGERDPDGEGVQGISASKMREAAMNNDYNTFEDGVAIDNPAVAKTMFQAVRQGMGLKDEVPA